MLKDRFLIGESFSKPLLQIVFGYFQLLVFSFTHFDFLGEGINLLFISLHAILVRFFELIEAFFLETRLFFLAFFVCFVSYYAGLKSADFIFSLFEFFSKF